MAVVDGGKLITMNAINDEVTSGNDVTRIEWAVTAATAGDEVVIKDGSGSVVAHFVTQQVNHVDRVYINKRITGLKATTLDSGTVYIHKA